MDMSENDLKQIILSAYQKGFKAARDSLNGAYATVKVVAKIPDTPEQATVLDNGVIIKEGDAGEQIDKILKDLPAPPEEG
jgi:hypothetical protein